MWNVLIFYETLNGKEIILLIKVIKNSSRGKIPIKKIKI